MLSKIFVKRGKGYRRQHQEQSQLVGYNEEVFQEYNAISNTYQLKKKKSETTTRLAMIWVFGVEK